MLITLTLTNNCNLACNYCYEKHNSDTMTFDTAVAIINKELQLNASEAVEIDFFGGEPFLSFDLIRKIVDYICPKKQIEKRNIHCFVSTNGTLVHGEVQEWLRFHKEIISCGLSADGTKKNA